MDRRTLLSGGAALAGGLAGCLSSDPPADGAPESPDDTPTDSPTPTSTASPTPSASPAAVSATFEVTSKGPGTGENAASITIADPVVVEGTIEGKNGCYTAAFGSAEVDEGTLRVVVKSFEEDTGGACTQSLVDIEYRATVTVQGRQPDTVVVEHLVDGERTTVARTEA